MAESIKKEAEILISEENDGSAVVDLPEDLQKIAQGAEEFELEGKSDSNSA